jgi:hypothetical protein
VRVGESGVRSGDPQLPQNRWEDGVSLPHAGHRVI